MSDPSVSTEPVPADSEAPLSFASGRSDEGHGDTGARVIALVVGVVVGTFIGVGIGIGIGNATRKQLDRWSISY